MQRITTATREIDKFGPGKDGFRQGVPALGLRSTQLEAPWFDHAQEEICNVIELNGLTLDSTDYTQLWQAINAQINAVTGNFVLRAGDTMTGRLTVPEVVVSNPNGINYFGSTNFVRLGWDGAFLNYGIDGGGFVQAASVGWVQGVLPNQDVNAGSSPFFDNPHINSIRSACTFATNATVNGQFRALSGNHEFHGTNVYNYCALGLDVAQEIHAHPDSYSAYLAPSGNGTCSGGGPWIAFSDARIKEDVQDYDAGLSEVLRLRPISYNYKENLRLLCDGDRLVEFAGRTGLAEIKRYVGLVAQEVEPIMPEMIIHGGKMEINGEMADDVLRFNGNALTYAFINAFKEVDARLRALEARS